MEGGGTGAARGGKGERRGGGLASREREAEERPPVCTIFYQFNSCIFAEAQREQKCRGREGGSMRSVRAANGGGVGEHLPPGVWRTEAAAAIAAAAAAAAAFRNDDGGRPWDGGWELFLLPLRERRGG